jgi:hypothetical protein
MLFQFNTWNHCPQGKIIVEDITRIMGAQMAALGHEVRWSDDSFIEDGVNVVLESFADDPRTLELISAAHAAGRRFLCVATEEPTATGFNHGLEPAMIDRQNAFAEAARYFDGILHLVPGESITHWYAEYAPAAHAEIGFAEQEVSIGHAAPTHDFGFYGKMTWRREQMLARLGDVVRITSLDVPRRKRDAIMRQARVIVQVRANEEWGMVSSTRCATAISFGRPIVAEPHPSPAPWDEVVRFSRSVDEFYEDAKAVAKDWRSVHAEQIERFRERLTPERCIGEPLRRIGITKL